MPQDSQLTAIVIGGSFLLGRRPVRGRPRRARWIGGSEQLDAADDGRSLLRRQVRHDLGDEIRGQHLADSSRRRRAPSRSARRGPDARRARRGSGRRAPSPRGVGAAPKRSCAAAQVLGLLADGQRAACREMLQHLQRAARDRQIRSLDPIGPVVPPVHLRKEAGHPLRGLRRPSARPLRLGRA
jgi:hypothetical protein